MVRKVREYTCKDCRHTWKAEDADTCPACGSDYLKSVLYIECCGKLMYCGGFTNTCEVCGADYNWAGQRLAPREQWGAETGETAAEILRIK